MKFNYIIYHKNCYDGFAGFFLLHHNNLIDTDAIIYPDQPFSKIIPPDIDNKDVIIVDVAYGIEILEEISKKTKSLLFIDHHVSTHLDIKNVNFKNTTVIYDKQHSGSWLVWNNFYNSKKIPSFIRYIEDSDTGKYSFNSTKSFMISLEVNYDLEPTMNNLIKWEKLFNKKEIIHLIKLGKFYLQYDDTLTNINKKKYVFTTFPSQMIFEKYNDIFKKKGQYKVAVYTGSPCPSIRSLSEKIQLESDCDIFMIWNYQLDKKKTIITMRSNKVDISEIAKAFGGGGHEGASSFSTDISIDNLFDEIVPR